jgi:hypothetical protein
MLGGECGPISLALFAQATVKARRSFLPPFAEVMNLHLADHKRDHAKPAPPSVGFMFRQKPGYFFSPL